MNMTVLFKKCTYGLLLITLVIGSFCSAGQVIDLLDLTTVKDISTEAYQRTTIVNFGNTNNSYTVCFSFDNFRGNIQAGIGSNPNSQPGTNFTYWNNWNGNYVCFYKSSVDNYLNVRTDYSDSITLNYFILNDLLVYNIDTNYCVSNNLCPVPENSWSALYINDIQHPGSALINITIPEELQRNYTEDEEEMNIDIVGYGYDQEKMQQLVNTQYYTPTPEDMSNLVGKVADFLPLLAIMLLVVRTWYLIKKAF